MTPSKLENVLSWGETPISDLIDDVVDLEQIAYNKRMRWIVKQTQRKRKLDLEHNDMYN
jgi:hypothetical protein